MPRNLRMFVQGVPVHVVQRGHDRQPVFRSDDDFKIYLSNLFSKKEDLSVQLLAYCLMTNHVHLILVPPEDPAEVSKLMKVVAGRQTRYVNRTRLRTGTLWEGRFKSSCIETSEYLLACYRYVELNPVRAGLVARPSDYRWSSYRAHIGAESNSALDDHEEFRNLADCHIDRARAYRKIVENTGVEDDEIIRATAQLCV